MDGYLIYHTTDEKEHHISLVLALRQRLKGKYRVTMLQIDAFLHNTFPWQRNIPYFQRSGAWIMRTKITNHVDIFQFSLLESLRHFSWDFRTFLEFWSELKNSTTRNTRCINTNIGLFELQTSPEKNPLSIIETISTTPIADDSHRVWDIVKILRNSDVALY